MEMRNLVKEKISANGYALGAFVASSSPMNCEILGLNGLDFVVIDCEHAETNSESIVQMCRASEMYGMAPLVRVYDPDDAPMQDSECIIAVNKNAAAPIFEIADYGVVGDLFQVVPMMIEQFKAAKEEKASV